VSFHHVGAVFHPGNGPTSIDQPVGDSASRTTRRLISVLSLAILFARQGVERGLGEVVLVPGPRRLAELVAELNGVGVLSIAWS